MFDSITASGSGQGTSLSPYLSLGTFYINTTLVEQHPTQRPVVADHVEELMGKFRTVGVNREDSPGVVIGIGEGWQMMRNSGPLPYMITPSCLHLHHLSVNGRDKPIGQVI